MSTDKNTNDPLQMAREATRAGVEKLRLSRERRAVEVAERAAREAAEAAEDEELERAFAKAEAEERRLQRLAEARARVEAAKTAYAPLATAADDLILKLGEAIAVAVKLAGDAIVAERERDTAGKALASAHAQLANLDTTAPGVNVRPLRLHNPSAKKSPQDLVLLAAVLVDPRFADQREQVIQVLNPKPKNPNIVFGVRN